MAGLKRDPMANYKMLSDEQKALVDSAVAKATEILGGEKVMLDVVLGFADAFQPVFKKARANSGTPIDWLMVRPQMLDEQAAAKVQKYLREGDTISYLLKSKGIVFENLRVIKITDKRITVRISENTSAVFAGERKPAGELGQSLSYGTKYVGFNSVQVVNSLEVYDFIAAKERATK